MWGSRENAKEPLLSYIYVDPGGSVQAASLAQGSLPVEPSHQPFLGFFEKKVVTQSRLASNSFDPHGLRLPGTDITGMSGHARLYNLKIYPSLHPVPPNGMCRGSC